MLLLFLLAIVFPVCVAGQSLPEKGICAHRGAMATHPENTIPAFEEAVRLGVQMIELDVRLTKDKKLVILHDETVDRTTDGKGRIGDLKYKKVRRLDAGSWKGSEFKGVKIPALEEALAVIPDNVWINVHLKGGELLGKKVARAIIKADNKHNAFLACSAEAAKGAHEVDPEIMICNMDRQASAKEYVNLTIRLNSDFIQFFRTPADDTLRQYIRRLKSHGIRVNYYSAETPEEVQALFDHGVDFVLVNDPAIIMRGLKVLNTK